MPIPTVTTGPPAEVSQTWFTVVCEVTDVGDALFAKYGIDYGLTADYGAVSKSTAWSNILLGEYIGGAPGLLQENLIPGTIYHYRARLETDTGVFYGGDATTQTLVYQTSLPRALLGGL